MTGPEPTPPQPIPGIVTWIADRPVHAAGDRIRVLKHEPISHYRVPTYLRGAEGVVERVIRPSIIDNEEEGFGRNAGHRGFYYRVALPMTQIWTDYAGPATDQLYIEIFETWLEKA